MATSVSWHVKSLVWEVNQQMERLTALQDTLWKWKKHAAEWTEAEAWISTCRLSSCVHLRVEWLARLGILRVDRKPQDNMAGPMVALCRTMC